MCIAIDSSCSLYCFVSKIEFLDLCCFHAMPFFKTFDETFLIQPLWNFFFISCFLFSILQNFAFLSFLVAGYATLHPALLVRPSVRPLVCLSVRHTLLFWGFWDFLLHCSCPNDLGTSITAPAHRHATWVAVYPALFNIVLILKVFL